MFLPNYFGGINGVPYLLSVDPTFHYVFLTVPGCLLALVGLIEMARRKNFFWLGLIVLCSIVAMGRTGYLVELLYHIPILNLFRHAPMYFDLANFGLCLMAAMGMRTLWDQAGHGDLTGNFLPRALMALLLLAACLGLAFQLAPEHPWLASHASCSGDFHRLVAGTLHGPFPARLWQYAVIGVVVFELCFHGMNQIFNSSAEDPRKTLSYDYVAGRKETLQFLRADHESCFRVAGFAESQWSNGWNLWRIRGIYGWNPIMLLGTRNTSASSPILPATPNLTPGPGQPDHSLHSPMLDLLGVKYLVVTRRVEEATETHGIEPFRKGFFRHGLVEGVSEQDHTAGALVFSQRLCTA